MHNVLRKAAHRQTENPTWSHNVRLSGGKNNPIGLTFTVLCSPHVYFIIVP